MLPWFCCWLPFIFLTSKCKTVPAFSQGPSCLSLYPPLMVSYRLMALNIIYVLITPKFLQLGSLFWNLRLYVDCLFASLLECLRCISNLACLKHELWVTSPHSGPGLLKTSFHNLISRYMANHLPSSAQAPVSSHP